MRTLPTAWLLLLGLAWLLPACGVESDLIQPEPAGEAQDALGGEDQSPATCGPSPGPDDHTYTGGPPSQGGSSAYPSGHPIGGCANIPTPAHEVPPEVEWDAYLRNEQPDLLNAMTEAEAKANRIEKWNREYRFSNSRAGQLAREAHMLPEKWRPICEAACDAAVGAACMSAHFSCVAGAFWSFGGVLIPCEWAVISGCSAGFFVAKACHVKCNGGG
jgi:hypothetical protein